MKITNIRVDGMRERIVIVCPNCSAHNSYFIYPQGKFQATRICQNCGAVLVFDCEQEVKEDNGTAEITT